MKINYPTINLKAFVFIQFIIAISIFIYLDYLAQANPKHGFSLSDSFITTLSEIFTVNFILLFVAFFIQLYAFSKKLAPPCKLEHAIPAGLLVAFVCGVNYLILYMVAGSPYRMVAQSLLS